MSPSTRSAKLKIIYGPKKNEQNSQFRHYFHSHHMYYAYGLWLLPRGGSQLSRGWRVPPLPLNETLKVYYSRRSLLGRGLCIVQDTSLRLQDLCNQASQAKCAGCTLHSCYASCQIGGSGAPIPVHATLLYLYFMPVLAKLSFISRTQNKNQTIQQPFFFVQAS